MKEKTRILIGSSVKQDPQVLDIFLNSLKILEKENTLIDYFFIDDNDISSASDLLDNFADGPDCRVIIKQGDKSNISIRTEGAHQWREDNIWKVAGYKNEIIEYSKEEAYDYLFLVDSDIVLHPKTLQQLISSNKDIVSEIFWTKWHKDSIALPQVWLYDHYSLVPKKRLEIIDKTESDKRYNRFIEQLKRPGVYEVGGLGACTLISNKALNAGVTFNEIYNISFWGEDRHFCIRAAALGFRLFVDTTFPAYHIYRKEDLSGVEEFKYRCKHEKKERISKAENNKLTLMMLVRNEGGKFLGEMLTHACQYIDNAVILDDASDDNSVEICQEVLQDIPLTLVSNQEPQFNKNEIALREQLWQMTIAKNPDWILCLDADEIFEDAIINNIKTLINQPDFDHYSFRLYDMWDKDHYREDQYWQAHKYYRIFLLRYQPNFKYCWNEKALHCGRVPQNVYDLPGCICYTRLKHFGWSSEKLREEKYQRYLSLDPEGKYGIMGQYESILDKNPTLVRWE